MIGNELQRYTHVKKEDVMRVYNQYLKGKPGVILSTVEVWDGGIRTQAAGSSSQR